MSPETATALLTLVSGLAIGLIAGGGSVLLLIGKVKNDPALLAAIEGLTVSASPEVIAALKQLVPVLRDGASIIEEATDGVPVGTKPPAN